jgi:adenylate kinase
MKFLLGPPCAGKGRVGSGLNNHVILSAGNILREMCETEQYGYLKPILNAGGLVATDLICEILIKKAKEYDYNLFIDGFPRTTEQAIMIKKFMNENKIKCNGVFVLQVPNYILYERTLNRTYCNVCYYTDIDTKNCCDKLMIKREDDNFETLSKRIEIFYSGIYEILNIMEGPIYFINNNQNINETIKIMNQYL